MERNSSCVLTNMCMVEDEIGRVLVQQRVDKNWSGIAFTGGHVEPGESLTESVIREVKEETGLKSRCIKEDITDGICAYCGKPAKYKIYFGKQY